MPSNLLLIGRTRADEYQTVTDTELLVRVLCRDQVGDPPARLAELKEAAWARLVDAAIWHGVAPLLHVRLNGPSGESLPNSQAQRLQDQYVHCLLHNIAIREQLQELVEEAAATGGSMAVLKGAYLANCVYEDPGARMMWDIDLLVPGEEIERFRDHLITRGYRATHASEGRDLPHHLAPMSKDGATPIELHRSLVPTHGALQVDIDTVWSRVTSTAAAGFELPHPAVDDVLLHLCLHTAFHHRFLVGLRGACDVDVLVRRLGDTMDWNRFEQSANLSGASPYVYTALRVTQELLRTPLPEEVLTSLAHEPGDESIVGGVVGFVTNLEGPMPATVQRVRESSSLMSAVTAAMRGIFPAPEVMRRVYGIERGGLRLALYYLVRPFDLLRRRGGHVMGFVMGAERERRMVDKDEGRRRITNWARRSPPGVQPGR